MRIAYHCADRVGERMAGPGIRAVELARRLAREHEVTLVAPGAGGYPVDGVRGVEFSPRSVREVTRQAGALVTQGFTLPLSVPLRLDGRLVLDLYDPVQLEQLARLGAAPSANERVSLAYVRARLWLLLGRADHVLCASDLQRAFWLGWLGSVGRLTPELAAADPAARRLLAVVPFGLPEAPPEPAPRGERPVRDRLGAGDGAKVALWGGGLWDWMDPELAVRACALLRDHGEDLHLVFLAGKHPGGHEMSAAAGRARAAAQQAHLEGRVHFVEAWVPYAERGRWLLDADVAVSAHAPTLEAELAFRTRLLDCLWAALPAACTRGDALAAEAERGGWGAGAEPGDAAGLAEAISRLCRPAENARARAAAREAAGAHRWDRSARTILELLAQPAPPRPPALVPGEVAGEGLGRVAVSVIGKLAKRLKP